MAHKLCLTKATACSPPTPSPALSVILPTINKLQQRTSLPQNSQQQQQQQQSVVPIENYQGIIERSNSFKQQLAPIVRAVYKYDGRPLPPEFPVLTFSPGDLIQVTDEDDDEWWKGFVVKNTKTSSVNLSKEEGYFPSRYVRPLANESLNEMLMHSNQPATTVRNSLLILEEYAWFAPVDRQTADQILNRIQNIPSQTLFMVRCRQEGGYAISIKFNGSVEHIKINVNYLESSSDASTSAAFYSIDQRNFSSVINLVKYYSQNSLKDNFPQLETTLGLAYRDALPTPISIAVAVHDYNPLMNPNNTGEQIDLKRFNSYYVINKEPNGWWRVYNSDGLIGYAPGGYLNETKKI